MTEYRCTWWEDTGSNSPFDALARKLGWER